jgi:putative lipoprotein
MQVSSVVRAGLAILLPLPLSLLHPSQAWAGRLQGVVLLRPPFTLPPQAILDVQLLEVSRADAPGVLIGRSRGVPSGRSPFPVVITVLDGAIQPTSRTVLRATVRAGDRLLFTTTTVVPVQLGRQAPVRLELEAVDGGPLRGYPWLRAPAASVPAPVDAPRREQQFTLDPLTQELSGSGDCNRFGGTYQLTGDRLRLLPLVQTQAACEPAVLADDQRFMVALGQVRRWRLDGQGRIELLGDAGEPLLRMEQRPR